ncbi:L-histidine N(alpha)-methyltransferase [Gordonia sp. TBRC 11910]|uniref:L-histidine N(Alpha)-methyltransferase n=1 Tax=Gordonia asplenii TaxID=2725283 RepID=A0A848L1X0_9ACTN|nr:L-histidine N(alpha)-methyltransferase [Gordonia asplenii]NMO02511.1 L-histidine N(alpha)-methyltransferase [Gordonia asplenii]
MTALDAGLIADAATLWNNPPTLPTKWLYDERGSKLFDEITRLPEYYPTRRETEILAAHSVDIAQRTDATLVAEFGSGTSTKSRLVLTAFADRAAAKGRSLSYVPIDVSAEVLVQAARELSADYPTVDVEPLLADFTRPLELPPSDGPRLAMFLGGTIGNFDAGGRADFFARIAAALNPGDFFLLGADLVKDTGRLVAAYDDKAGVTADFNRNIVEVLRTSLNATGLYADDFDHIARWNPREHRIEMWLRARRDVDAHFAALNRDWHLPRGTEVLTEISTKFDVGALGGELASAGLTEQDSWTDSHGDFVVMLVGLRARRALD